MATHDFDFTDPYGNEDRKRLYRNPDSYFNNWSSNTQSEEVVEELFIQETTYYDDRRLSSSRTAEAESAEWKRRYELERSRNQELPHNGSRITGAITYNSRNLPGLLSFGVIEILMMVVASVVPNFLTGLITGAGLIGIIMASSGFSHLLSDIPNIFCRYSISYCVSYMIFGSWAIKLGHRNDILEPEMTGGEEVNMNEVGVKVMRSEWWGFPEIVIAILVCTWLIFFVAQKLKERSGPASRGIQAKVCFDVQLS
ncbi:hypothetical protein CARUB_v10014452mg [Capsella rubella]|uniref:Uncharacterized protein n=1 Tax=Capsella rubella TaxID=81985 RepID=R0G735_9BRAS|nr:ABC transporter G family member 15 [Capsella rubella]EOA31281.1 hypothetical protein CARUB_v10014452mg [Capsella rubella]